MRIRKPSPKPVAIERSERARHIFAAMMDGRGLREIAEAEGIGVRRVQQIVAEELARDDVDPADDYALLQIARLEHALELLGAQIDAGKTSAIGAFLRVIEQLGRLTRDRFHLEPSPRGLRYCAEVEGMDERLRRLAATREMLAERRAARERACNDKSVKSNAGQVSDIVANGEIADFAAQ